MVKPALNVSQLNKSSTGFVPLTFTVNGQSTLNYTCADVGTMGVTLTLTDAYGTTSACAATITVADNAGPSASCQDLTVELVANGNTAISTCAVDAGSADACGAFLGYALDQTSFNCSDLGINQVTMTVTDINGNSSTCISNITVQDNSAPSVNCRNTTIQLGVDGTASCFCFRCPERFQ